MTCSKTGALNDGFLLNALKKLLRLSRLLQFRSLEMHSKRCYKICICSVILGQLIIESFRNDKGFSIIFRGARPAYF